MLDTLFFIKKPGAIGKLQAKIEEAFINLTVQVLSVKCEWKLPKYTR